MICEPAAGQRSIGRRQIARIEDIEHLHAELGVDALCDVGILEHREIHLVRGGAIQGVPAFISVALFLRAANGLRVNFPAHGESFRDIAHRVIAGLIAESALERDRA